MFTGIIQKVGKIAQLTASQAQSSTIIVESGFVDVSLGESIAVNGVCLTVTEFTPQGNLTFFVGFETLNRSNLDLLREGSSVNLERALLASERLSGHIVQGHVDGQARFLGAEFLNDCWKVRLELPDGLSRYCVEKGSIALNGVSLTLAGIEDSEIWIMLIPHTWDHTVFSKMKAGDRVNVEVDVLAKYMEKLCQPYFKQ